MIVCQCFLWRRRIHTPCVTQTGCLGCASGKGAGPRNIFGNKYGQSLAAVQVARERRLEAKRLHEEERRRLEAEKQAAGEEETDASDETDEDDYGPTPSAGIWAGSQKLQHESEKIAGDDDGTDDSEDEGPQPAAKLADDDEETDDSDDDEGPEPKKARTV